MLILAVPGREVYNEETNEFLQVPDAELHLEHSLLSVFRWEAIWKKPFLDRNKKKTTEELISYVECMCLDKKVNSAVFYNLGKEHWDAIAKYIDDEQTATWFSKSSGASNRETLTAELIYYYMTAYNIPFECQKWHLSRLLVLLRICGIKNSPEKKMSTSNILSQNAKLNAARRKAMHTKG